MQTQKSEYSFAVNSLRTYPLHFLMSSYAFTSLKFFNRKPKTQEVVSGAPKGLNTRKRAAASKHAKTI